MSFDNTQHVCVGYIVSIGTAESKVPRGYLKQILAIIL